MDLLLSKFDHLHVAGIVEDGPRAEAEIVESYSVTPLAIDLRRQAASLNLGELRTKLLLGEDIMRLPDPVDRYEERKRVQFAKYDDGWRLR